MQLQCKLSADNFEIFHTIYKNKITVIKFVNFYIITKTKLSTYLVLDELQNHLKSSHLTLTPKTNCRLNITVMKINHLQRFLIYLRFNLNHGEVFQA